MTDTLTASAVAWTCLLALLTEMLVAYARRSIPHATLSVAIGVLLVIYIMSLAGVYEPVQLRTPLRLAIAGIMVDLFLIHRHEAWSGLLLIRARIKLWKIRRRG
jgi:hypothetical protein